jgi:hypothetical protein
MELNFFSQGAEERFVPVVMNGQSRALSHLLAADRVLADLRALSEEITEAGIQGRRLRSRLLATAEQDTGLPCAVADMDVRPGSSTRVGWALHRTDVLEYVTRAGGTDYVPWFHHQQPSFDDRFQCVRAALSAAASRVWAIKAALLVAFDPLRGGDYGFDRTVPHEASPCGILRLAAPIVPGAPGGRSWPPQTTMTFAA